MSAAVRKAIADRSGQLATGLGDQRVELSRGPHFAVLGDQPVGDRGDAIGGDGVGGLRRESGEHQLVAVREMRLHRALADRHGEQQQSLHTAAHHPLLQLGRGEDA